MALISNTENGIEFKHISVAAVRLTKKVYKLYNVVRVHSQRTRWMQKAEDPWKIQFENSFNYTSFTKRWQVKACKLSLNDTDIVWPKKGKREYKAFSNVKHQPCAEEQSEKISRAAIQNRLKGKKQHKSYLLLYILVVLCV